MAWAETMIGISSRAGSCFLAIFLLCPSLSSAADPSQDLFAMDGSLSLRYVFRDAKSSLQSWNDQDLFGELRFDLTMPRNNRYAFHFLGTGRKDIDGDREPRTFYPLEDIGDTGNHSAKAYISDAHLDVNNLFSRLPQIRLGRQAGTRDEPVFFDGIALDLTASDRINLTLYGGSAVHFYELYRDSGDDTVAGAGIDLQVLRSTSLSIDYLGAEDERTYPSDTDAQDNMLSLKLWHRFSPGLRAMAKYRYLNGDPRDFTLRAVALYAPADIELNANYFRQFTVQNELANEFSVYYDIIGRTNPYETYDVKARKLFGEHYALDLGYYSRDLREKRHESSFNRRYNRAYATAEMIGLLLPGLSVSVTGETWKSGERAYRTWGGDLSYTFLVNAKKATVSTGTYFSLYKYDYYIERGERTKARTYFVNARYPIRSDLWVNAAYEFERAIEDYQTVKLGMRYDF
ncbi:MAG TPA: hypothetical protein VN604_01545 [Nitrospirota bacterium]|nr:hypothetical protein [Nitrospirota bacterium]